MSGDADDDLYDFDDAPSGHGHGLPPIASSGGASTGGTSGSTIKEGTGIVHAGTRVAIDPAEALALSRDAAMGAWRSHCQAFVHRALGTARLDRPPSPSEEQEQGQRQGLDQHHGSQSETGGVVYPLIIDAQDPLSLQDFLEAEQVRLRATNSDGGGASAGDSAANGQGVGLGWWHNPAGEAATVLRKLWHDAAGEWLRHQAETGGVPLIEVEADAEQANRAESEDMDEADEAGPRLAIVVREDTSARLVHHLSKYDKGCAGVGQPLESVGAASRVNAMSRL